MAAHIDLNLFTEGENGAIDADSFLVALQASLELLRELDAAVSGGKCQWRYTRLGIGSGLSTIEGTLPEQIEDAAERDFLEQELQGRYIKGFVTLEHGPIQPSGFTVKALDAASRLAAVLRDGVSRIVTSADGYDEVVITERIVANIKQLLGHGFTDIGTVEGRLETVSLAGRHIFNVRDETTGRLVTCALSTSLLQQVKDSLGMRVLVSGEVTYSRHGEPSEVSPVEEIEPLGEEYVPTIEDVRGIEPNLTEGQPSGEYVRNRFDG